MNRKLLMGMVGGGTDTFIGAVHRLAALHRNILIHGLIFGFFYVGGQIYIDKKAPANLKAQAQGFIFLVTFGVGLLGGNLLCAKLIDHYKTTTGYNWDAIWGIITLASIFLLLSFVVLFKDEKNLS